MENILTAKVHEYTKEYRILLGDTYHKNDFTKGKLLVLEGCAVIIDTAEDLFSVSQAGFITQLRQVLSQLDRTLVYIIRSGEHSQESKSRIKKLASLSEEVSVALIEKLKDKGVF